MKCFACRKRRSPMWWIDGHWHPIASCCRETTGEIGARPDVAQWLRTRAVKVAWLICAARHIPGLTVKERP